VVGTTASSIGEATGPIWIGALAGYEAAREKLEKRMRAELGAIAARDGDKKLRRGNLEIFRRMFIIRDSG
jgi:hypothetical protein